MQAWITEPIIVPMPLLALLIVLNMAFWSMLTIFIQWVVGRYRGKCTCGFVEFVFGANSSVRKARVVLGLELAILRLKISDLCLQLSVFIAGDSQRSLERFGFGMLGESGEDVLRHQGAGDGSDRGHCGEKQGIVGTQCHCGVESFCLLANGSGNGAAAKRL